MTMKMTPILIMAAAGCAAADMCGAATPLQVELREIHCTFPGASAKDNSPAVMLLTSKPCTITLQVSTGAPDKLLSELKTVEITATDAKGNSVGVSPSPMPVMSDDGDSAQSIMLKLDAVPKGGSVTLKGTLSAQVAGGANTHAPQEFDATKGGSFTAGSVAYTLAAGKNTGFFGFGGDESATAVEMRTEHAAAIKDVAFTTASGKAVRINGTFSMNGTKTYMLDTEEKSLRIVVSTYKGFETMSGEVDMTVSLSGEVKKKAADAAPTAKPKQKKPKKK